MRPTFQLNLSRLAIVTTSLFSLLFIPVGSARAQGLSAYFGLGSATDTAGTTNTTTASCPPGNLFDDFTGACEPGPTLGGVWGVFGADYMFRPHFGVNGEYAFRFAQAPYLPSAGLNMRPAFYDFNGVYEPISGSGKRVVPVLEGGIGGARVELYFTQSGCITGICTTQSYPAGLNANHFQVHAAARVKIYIKGELFVKPQFDFHYVSGFTDQFGRDWVPQYTIAVGYSFGQR